MWQQRILFKTHFYINVLLALHWMRIIPILGSRRIFCLVKNNLNSSIFYNNRALRHIFVFLRFMFEFRVNETTFFRFIFFVIFFITFFFFSESLLARLPSVKENDVFLCASDICWFKCRWIDCRNTSDCIFKVRWTWMEFNLVQLFNSTFAGFILDIIILCVTMCFENVLHLELSLHERWTCAFAVPCRR